MIYTGLKLFLPKQLRYNSNMVRDWLEKFYFYVLLILASINVYAFVLSQNIGDNYLSISSGNATINLVSFYVNSCISFVSAYTGFWIVFPSLVYFVLYRSIFSKRSRKLDNLSLYSLLSFFVCFFALAWPEFLGEAIRSTVLKFGRVELFFFSSLLFFVLTCYLILRGAFWSTLKLFKAYILKMSLSVTKLLQQLFEKVKLKRVFVSMRKTKSRISHQASKMVQAAPAGETRYSAREERKEEPNSNLTPGAKPLVVDTPASFQTKSGLRAKASKKSDSNQQVLEFESQELIECLTDKSNPAKTKGPDKNYFESIISTIEGKLSEFNVKGNIINVLKGPVVDTFELDLGEGIKASKVKGLEDDIGLALNGVPIRVVYPLKGRSTIGIEVPRNPREFIYLDEVLRTHSFTSANHRLPIAMGKDAFGETTVVDLAAMPHMLVAGATGAGKSVFINTLLVSLIVKKTYRDLKLILIDPKQLELALFSSLPHLLLPVITDAKRASIALLWTVEEMERRYSLLKDLGAKGIEGFNRKVRNATPEMLGRIHHHYEFDGEENYQLPYIVVIIDEFADLILTKSGKDIETNVNRLAAKARAAGIHLVLATQRPSTDVITGVIKANFPTRVAFRVTTGHDSKTILDQHGAQKLLGKGDMLYKHGVDLMRLHSSYVDEAEIETLVSKLSEVNVDYDEKALDFLENDGQWEEEMATSTGKDYVSGTSQDPVYQEALQVVTELGQASASMLQRKLRVGYNRAANIIDELEKNGVVGPAEGSKPRKVLRS